MLAFRLLKEWKKRLKRQRRPVWSLGALLAFVVLASAAGYAGYAGASRLVGLWAVPAVPAAAAEAQLPAADVRPVRQAKPDSPRDRTIAALAGWDGEVEVVLRRSYLCGEEVRRLGRLTTGEALDLLRAHRDWTASFDGSGRVVMEESVDDLSPECRKNAYIAMDAEGNLSLYDGPPKKENVIRTFFQLDVRTLESSLSKEQLHELARGIRITDRDEYNSVISTYSDYARQRTQDVMKPAE